MKGNSKASRAGQCFLPVIALAVALTSGAQAQSWETVLDYQMDNGSAGGNSLAVDEDGNVFAGGKGNMADTVHGLVLKTDSAQVDWFLSDNSNHNPAQYNSYHWDLGFDAAGNLYSAGQLTLKSSGIPFWLIRKSSDRGLTWSTVDLYQYAPGRWANASGFAADELGNIYIAGWVQDGTKHKNNHWIVRKSSDAGQSWQVVDDVLGFQAATAAYIPGAGLFVVGPKSAGPSTTWRVRFSQNLGASWATVDTPFAGGARAVASDSTGAIYVTGVQSVTPSRLSYGIWITRQSINGGATWTTVDSYNLVAGKSAGATAIGTDADGKIVVAGGATDAQGKLHWIVRNVGPTGAWQTVDDFQAAPGLHSSAQAIATDAAGNLLVSGNGYAQIGADGQHWIVRRFPYTPQ